MIDELRKYCFTFLYKRKKRKTVTFPHFEKIENIVIVLDVKNYGDDFAVKAKSLLQNDKKVSFWVLSDNPVELSWEKDVTVFRQGDFNMFGNIKKSIRREVSHDDFDLLLDVRSWQNIKFDYLVLLAQAHFNVGPTGCFFPFNMCVSLPQRSSAIELLEQMIYYLKNIKSND